MFLVCSSRLRWLIICIDNGKMSIRVEWSCVVVLPYVEGNVQLGFS